MERDLGQRNEKRSKRSNDPIDHQIRGIVVRELDGGGEDVGQGSGQQAIGQGSQKAQPRRGSGSDAGHGSASHGVGATGHEERPTDYGGREGKTIPAIGAPDPPPRFLEFDQSYMVQHQGAQVRREPVIYDHGVKR